MSRTDPFAKREAQKYEHPIPSREFILEWWAEFKQPAKIEQVIKAFNLSQENELEAVARRVKAMVRDGQLERLKGGYFWPKGQRVLVQGKVMFDKHHAAWLIPETGGPRLLLHIDNWPQVHQGAKIIASVIDAPEFDKREANLVEVLEQPKAVITGRLVQDDGVRYIIPHSKEFTQHILVPETESHSLRDGDIVVVEITRHASRWSEPIGKIIEVLGHENAHGIEIKSAVRAYGLPDKWPEGCIDSMRHLTPEVPAAAKRGREDIRHLPLVTIDGEDAKDFDDAIYCERRPQGGWRLWVAIADVSYYVKPKTILDETAQERGNSVYFPGKVIPMLPVILSNELCSLKPEVDRLCMACEILISKTGKMTRYRFFEGVMHSKARLTYTKVAAILEGSNAQIREQYQAVVPHLEAAYELYQALRVQREQRGAIDFNTVETRIIYGRDGKISRIEPYERNEAHRLIEEFMLCANVAAARFLKQHQAPSLYRNHEAPQLEKVTDLRAFLQELGLGLEGGKKPTPLDYSTVLKKIANRPDANVIQTVLLRSLTQAVYSPENVGHFGLAYPAYCHFTSPIRRYPDLCVHRQIKAILKGQWEKTSEAQLEKLQAHLLALGEHCSMTERRADEATRDVTRWLKCQYIHKHVGEEFMGIISGVTRFGFFVELKDIYIDGLVHIASLKNDYYFFDAVQHRLIGERTGQIYKLGDTVTVRVSRVDVDERKIDFELIAKYQSPCLKTDANKKKKRRPRARKRK